MKQQLNKSKRLVLSTYQFISDIKSSLHNFQAYMNKSYKK